MAEEIESRLEKIENLLGPVRNGAILAGERRSQ
jgi:hypothetical protein